MQSNLSLGARVLLALLPAFAASCPAAPSVAYGLLHAHTSFSDGTGTPAEAYAMAKSAGIQFFAVTPHNHAKAEAGAKERTDGVLIATNTALYDSPDTLTILPAGGAPVQVVSVQRAAKEATTSNFAPLFGQEFSTISAGNHMNVFGYPRVLTAGNGDFPALFVALDAHVAEGNPPPVVQLNHPDIQADLFYKGNNTPVRAVMFNDYGFDDYGDDFAAMVKATGRYVVLCEILSGPAMAKKNQPNYRYGDNHEDDYYYYLTQGFHLSPSAGQDNHYRTWGMSTPARMGVVTEGVSAAELYQAMRHNRTFATEDRNLSIEISVNGSPMGSCITATAGTDLTIRVALKDADEPDASYEVTLVQGAVSPQTRATLEKRSPRDGEREPLERTGDGFVEMEGIEASGGAEFFYVRVKQSDSDRAWSGPVWINHPREDADEWVWTAASGSRVYHHAWCRLASGISAANRRTGSEPPAGRTLHNCTRGDAAPGH